MGFSGSNNCKQTQFSKATSNNKNLKTQIRVQTQNVIDSKRQQANANPGQDRTCTIVHSKTSKFGAYQEKHMYYIPSKYMKTPSFRRHGLRCLTMTAGRTFFLRSGFPFLTVAITISPTQADGNLFKRPLIPFTEMMYRFLAPVLSAQFTVAATGRPSDILNLLPADPPRPAPQEADRSYTFQSSHMANRSLLHKVQ